MPKKLPTNFDLLEVEKIKKEFKDIFKIKVTAESLLRQLHPDLKKAVEMGYSFEIIDNMVHQLTKKRIGANIIKQCFDALENESFKEAQKSTEKNLTLEEPKPQKKGRKLKGEQTSLEPPLAEGTGPVLADPDLS